MSRSTRGSTIWHSTLDVIKKCNTVCSFGKHVKSWTDNNNNDDNSNLYVHRIKLGKLAQKLPSVKAEVVEKGAKSGAEDERTDEKVAEFGRHFHFDL